MSDLRPSSLYCPTLPIFARISYVGLALPLAAAIVVSALRHAGPVGDGLAVHLLRGIPAASTCVSAVAQACFLKALYDLTCVARNRGLLMGSSPILAVLTAIVPVLNLYALPNHLVRMVRASAMRVPEDDEAGALALEAIRRLAVCNAGLGLASLLPSFGPLALVKVFTFLTLGFPFVANVTEVFTALASRLEGYRGRAGEGPAFAY